MARIRTVKPDFWTDEKMVEMPFETRLFFIGLWNFVDDEGRIQYSPKKLKMLIFPADSVDVPRAVQELSGNGRIAIYQVDGIEYLEVINFTKHQRIDKRSTSKLPAPPTSSESPRLTTNPAESRRIPTTEGNGMEGNGMEGREEVRSRGSRLPPDWQPAEDLKAWASKERPDLDLARTLAKFRDYWIAKPGKAGTKLDWPATFRNWVREEKSGNGSAPPAPDVVASKHCRYCSAPAIGSVGGIDHCRAHSDEAFDRKSA